MARADKWPVTRARRYRQGSRLVLWNALGGVALVVAYGVLFQVLMAREGQSHSWASALYWTIATMCTLGYGDITFGSNLGWLFSMLVLLSGILLFVVMLPFSVVQFIVAPWMDRRAEAQAPRRVPPDLSGHIILVGHDVVTQTLVARAKRSRKPTVVLVDDPSQAARLHEDGYRAMVGALDSPETYRRARVQHAAMVASTWADATNANVAFTVRRVDSNVTIAVTAEKEASVDVLEIAGADHVLQATPTLGKESARRILGTTGRPHVIGNFGQTQIAEAVARGTALVGLTLAEARQQVDSELRVLATMGMGKLRPLAAQERIDDKQP